MAERFIDISLIFYSMRFKEVYDIAVPQKKREMEKWNIFAANISRPISVLMTIPLVNTRIKPTTVTLWSVIAAIIGAILLSFGDSMGYWIAGLCFLYLWNLLDGVDGNLARCQNTCSKRGELWDAFGGYAALVLTFISVSIAAYNDPETFFLFDRKWLLILGGLTSSLSIFPRLMLHKKMNMGLGEEDSKKFRDKKNFDLKQIISLNIISATGFMQVFILIGILTHTLSLLISFYFVVYLIIAIASLIQILK